MRSLAGDSVVPNEGIVTGATASSSRSKVLTGRLTVTAASGLLMTSSSSDSSIELRGSSARCFPDRLTTICIKQRRRNGSIPVQAPKRTGGMLAYINLLPVLREHYDSPRKLVVVLRKICPTGSIRHRCSRCVCSCSKQRVQWCGSRRHIANSRRCVCSALRFRSQCRGRQLDFLLSAKVVTVENRLVPLCKRRRHLCN